MCRTWLRERRGLEVTMVTLRQGRVPFWPKRESKISRQGSCMQEHDSPSKNGGALDVRVTSASRKRMGQWVKVCPGPSLSQRRFFRQANFQLQAGSMETESSQPFPCRRGLRNLPRTLSRIAVLEAAWPMRLAPQIILRIHSGTIDGVSTGRKSRVFAVGYLCSEAVFTHKSTQVPLDL